MNLSNKLLIFPLIVLTSIILQSTYP